MLRTRFKLDCRMIRKLDYFVATYTSEVFVNCISFYRYQLFAAANEFEIFSSSGIFFKLALINDTTSIKFEHGRDI